MYNDRIFAIIEIAENYFARNTETINGRKIVRPLKGYNTFVGEPYSQYIYIYLSIFVLNDNHRFRK